jgi:hypothetical protein
VACSSVPKVLYIIKDYLDDVLGLLAPNPMLGERQRYVHVTSSLAHRLAIALQRSLLQIYFLRLPTTALATTDSFVSGCDLKSCRPFVCAVRSGSRNQPIALFLIVKLTDTSNMANYDQYGELRLNTRRVGGAKRTLNGRKVSSGSLEIATAFRHTG